MQALLLTPLLLLACGEGEGRPLPNPEPLEDRPVTAEEAEPGHASLDRPPARLVRFEGEVTVAGAAVAAGSVVEADRAIEVGEGSRAVLQLRDGGRIEIDAESTARVVEDGAAQLLLSRGSLWAAQPPSGNAPTPPLRVVSPSVTVEIGQAGELYLALFPSGASWVSVLGGGVTLTTGEADVRRRLRTSDFVAGQAIAVPGRIAEPTEGPSRLSAAREAAALLARADVSAPDAERAQREVANEAGRLDQALVWLETETRRGSDLTARHRTAVHAGNEEESQRLQRELVEHARSLYRLRRLATARWERLRAVHLFLTSSPGGDDPVAVRRDRVSGLLGFR